MKLRRRFRVIGQILAAGFYGVLVLWGFGAVWFSNLPKPWLRIVAAIVFAIAAMALAWQYRRHPRWTTGGAALLLIGGVIVWWLLIPATNDRPWLPQFARMPKAVRSGNLVTIENIRDFRYRTETDFTSYYFTATYDLDQLRTMEVALCYWDGNTAIAHSMLSFGFADGRHLVFSGETRLAQGQVQNALAGLFKQYGILFIVGTEDDIFKLRTNYRHEQLYLYPSNSPPEDVRKIFLSLLERANTLLDRPQFYNTLTFNCTTSLLPSAHDVVNRHCDVRFCLNGYGDRMAWQFGWLKHRPDERFADYKARHYVNQYTDKMTPADNYSQVIRPAENF